MNNLIEESITRAAQHRGERKPTDAAHEWAEAVQLSRQQNDIPNLIQSLRGTAETKRDLGRNREQETCTKKRYCCAENRTMHCYWLTRCDTWAMFDAKSDGMRVLNPATKKHSASIAKSCRRILSM